MCRAPTWDGNIYWNKDKQTIAQINYNSTNYNICNFCIYELNLNYNVSYALNRHQVHHSGTETARPNFSTTTTTREFLQKCKWTDQFVMLHFPQSLTRFTVFSDLHVHVLVYTLLPSERRKVSQNTKITIHLLKNKHMLLVQTLGILKTLKNYIWPPQNAQFTPNNKAE